MNAVVKPANPKSYRMLTWAACFSQLVSFQVDRFVNFEQITRLKDLR